MYLKKIYFSPYFFDGQIVQSIFVDADADADAAGSSGLFFKCICTHMRGVFSCSLMSCCNFFAVSCASFQVGLYMSEMVKDPSKHL